MLRNRTPLFWFTFSTLVATFSIVDATVYAKGGWSIFQAVVGGFMFGLAIHWLKDLIGGRS